MQKGSCMDEPRALGEDSPRDLRLDVVRYQNVPGGWVLLLNWTVLRGDAEQGAVTGIQLYRDPEQRQPAGRRIDATATGPGEWSQTAAGFNLVPGQPYWIALIDVRNGKQPTSNSVPVLWEPMRFVSLACDGRVLDLGWQPSAPPFSDYEMGLSSPAGQPLFGRRLQSVGVPLPGQLPPGGLYGARVPFDSLPLTMLDLRLPFWMRQVYQAQDGLPGLALGPSENAQSYIRPPVLLSARFAGGDAATGLQYAVRLRIPGDDFPTPTFSAEVTADGRSYAAPVLLDARADTPDKTWAVTVRIPPAAAFGTGGAGGAQVSAGTAFALRIARADAVSVGPYAQIEVPTWAPAVTGAVYSGASGGLLALRLAQPDGAAALVTVTGTGPGGGAPVTATVQGPRGTVPLPVTAGVGYAVTAAAAADGLLGPAGTPVGLLTMAPSITSVRYEGEIAFVRWNAPHDGQDARDGDERGGTGAGEWDGGGTATGDTAAGAEPTGYVVRVHAEGNVVAETVVGATSAVLPVLAGDRSLTLDVSALALTPPDGPADTAVCVVEGPPSVAVALPTAVPGAPAATTDPVTGVTTLTWPAVPDATGYEVRAYRAGAPAGPPVSVAGPSWSVPQPVEPFAQLAVTVAAVTAADGISSTGPAGPLSPLPTARPGAVSASYDGVAATVAWGAAAGAIGYEISILADGAVVAHAAAGATDTSATLVLADAPAAVGYRAVVQARTDTGTGPATDPAALLTSALFLSTAPATSELPHLFTAVHPGTAPGDLVAGLPDLGVKDPATSLPIQKPPFVLSAAGPGAAHPYQLTVLGGGSAWSFPAGSLALRKDVRDAYTALLVAAEQAGVVGPALFALMNAVARILPQTFAETLYYAAGLDASARTVDLRPGLVLRVTPASYLTVAQSTEWTNGYVGGPGFELEVGGYLDKGQWQNGFDAFIARLASAGAIDVPGPYTAGRNQSGIAAAADLFAPGLRQPYHRLFTPAVLENPTGPGSVQVAANFVLTAAAKYADLVRILNPAVGASSGYFRGRAVVTPCARITVNGAAATVPLGTTVGGLLDGYASRPIGGRIRGLTLRRPDGPVVLGGAGDGAGGTDAVVAIDAHRAVRFDWGELPVYGGGLDALALPLLPGDRIGFVA